MPGEAARFPGDEAETYDQDCRGESDRSPERHNRSVHMRNTMRKQLTLVAILWATLTVQVR